MASYTIQSLIYDRRSLHGYCHNSRCHHNQRIDLEKLRDKLGPDHPAMRDDLIGKFRCSKCGGKEIGLIYAADETKHGGMMDPAGNAYQKAKEGR